MLELSATTYLWIRAGHIISVMAWMAGMLYLPRLFVYHVSAEPGSDKSETFKVMERRLLRAIINPAMIASFLFGGILLAELSPGIWSDGWIYAKLACILGMVTVHGMMAGWRKAFAEDRNVHSEKYYRVANEVPTVLMIGVVIFAVVRPF
ncbi:MAG: protoporphyrinogen oxidase HemJ [Rhodospirillales bacterium]|nr:protoporphyrinogen oxidase HemJ [Rhodospirillales bacterium]